MRAFPSAIIIPARREERERERGFLFGLVSLPTRMAYGQPARSVISVWCSTLLPGLYADLFLAALARSLAGLLSLLLSSRKKRDWSNERETARLLSLVQKERARAMLAALQRRLRWRTIFYQKVSKEFLGVGYSLFFPLSLSLEDVRAERC